VGKVPLHIIESRSQVPTKFHHSHFFQCWPASTKIVLHLGATDWLESPEVSFFPQLGPLGCATIELLLNDGNKESFLHG